MYWNSVEHHIGAEHVDNFWMSHPLIREEINRRVSGRADWWPTTWFRHRFAGRFPFGRALTIGCGTGNLERDIVGQGICSAVEAIDVVEGPLRYAEQQAAAEGLAGSIRYEIADAREYLRSRPRQYDAILFHASLHHFDRVDELMGLVAAALKPDGILYIDEFVGPSMHQWNVFRLFPVNLAYYLLPRGSRRPWLVRTPVNREDPTEAVAAAEILPAVYRHFRVLERRDYGGNLLSIIYANLARSSRLDDAVRRLIRFENALLRTGVRPFHTVIVGQPRS